jgi:hypothetical protein
MAISLPATSLLLRVQAFGQRKPILSGDAAADIEFGWRGVNNQGNYGYANRTMCLASESMWDDSPLLTTTAKTYGATAAQTYGQTRVYLGADVAEIRVKADVTDGGVQIRTSVGNGAGSTLKAIGTGVSARSVRTDSVAPGATGQWIDIVVAVAQDWDAADADLRAFSVFELELVAGDIP